MTHPFAAPSLLDPLRQFVDCPSLLLMQASTANTTISNYFSNVKNKVVVFFWLEYNRTKYLETLLEQHHQYYLKHGHLKNYFIFLSVHDYPQQLKEKYKDHFTLIVDPLLYRHYTDHVPPAQIKHGHKHLHFLSVNNRASPHRQLTYYFFEKFGLRKKSYFSYHGSLARSSLRSHDEISKHYPPDNPIWYLQGMDLEKLNQQIPVTISGDCFDNSASEDCDWSHGQEFFYSDTFCSLVLDTYCSEDQVVLDEKSFKPIAYGHPFLLLCNRGGLKTLRSIGFKTFGDYWDESYDNLQGYDRLETIFKLMLEIEKWSVEDINSVYTDMQPILEHNRQHFYKTLPEQFEKHSVSLFSDIKNLVFEKQKLFGVL
jgi:hypothetical protein